MACASAVALLGCLVSVVAPSLVTSGRHGMLVVRLYDAVGVALTVEARATALADQLLGSAFVAVQWRQCAARSSRPPEPACGQPLGIETATREVAVRITPSPDGGRRVRRGVVLGEAFVVRTLGQGELATVYYDVVQRMAADAGIDDGVLLGRTLAHELGHLLLGTRSHTGSGLMRGKWTASDLRHDALEDWRFTPPDVAAIWRNARDWNAGGAAGAALEHH